MQTTTPPIVSTRNQEISIFERLENDGILKAYTECVEAKARPWYIPELVDAKIAPNCNKYLWHYGFTQPSIVATGRTKGGKAVVVYAHCPNYFSDLENLKKVYQTGLINGAGFMPQDEFLKLLDMGDEKTVFVRDHPKLVNYFQGEIKVSKCSTHPMVVPFFGGKERAELYLETFSKKKGKGMCLNIEMYFNIVNDLSDVATGRWLVLGGADFCKDLGDSCGFYYGSRILAVEPSDERSEPVIVPSKEDALKTAVSEAKPLENIIQSILILKTSTGEPKNANYNPSDC